MSDLSPAYLPCIACGHPSEVSISMERNGVIAHYGSCYAQIERVARRVRGDAGQTLAHRPDERPAAIDAGSI